MAWQVTAWFVLGAVLTGAGAYAARTLAIAAEADGPTAASRFWWGVAGLSGLYAVGSLWLAVLREDDRASSC
jgi:hypothetical protein